MDMGSTPISSRVTYMSTSTQCYLDIVILVRMLFHITITKSHIMKRFYNKIEKRSNGCWEWIGAYRNVNTYGCLKYNGKVVDAHRVSWIIHNGEIPDGIFVCHKCDNKKCVNPDHLFLGTHSDNMKDAYKKGLVILPTNGNVFKKGHKPKNKRLTDHEAEKVKKAIKNKGKKSLKKLSKELDLPYQLLRDINCGRVY